MTMNSERQPEPTVLLLAILINSSVLYGSPGNENACVRILQCMCVFHLPALISIGFWGGLCFKLYWVKYYPICCHFWNQNLTYWMKDLNKELLLYKCKKHLHVGLCLSLKDTYLEVLHTCLWQLKFLKQSARACKCQKCWLLHATWLMHFPLIWSL